MDVLILATAAFVAGLLGSLHCIGMCSGIACSMAYLKADQQSPDIANSIIQKQVKKIRFVNALKFNLGRIVTYALLGTIAGFIGHRFSLLGGSTRIMSLLKIVSAALIALIGFKYLFRLTWIDFLEHAGQRVWQKINTLFFAKTSPQQTQVIALGMLWGFLPCGLIYTLLASAIASGSAIAGGLVMLAFGLGTLPSMLGVSAFTEAFRSTIQDRWVQILCGSAFVVLSVFLIATELLSSGVHHHH